MQSYELDKYMNWARSQRYKIGKYNNFKYKPSIKRKLSDVRVATILDSVYFILFTLFIDVGSTYSTI